MKQENLLKLEKTLDKYCRKHLARGGTLIRGGYWDGNNLHCCPVRASIVLKQMPSEDFLEVFFNWVRKLFGRKLIEQPYTLNIASYPKALSDVLGFQISDVELNSFVHGYDSGCSGYRPDDAPEKELYFLGKKFADKYQPTPMP